MAALSHGHSASDFSGVALHGPAKNLGTGWGATLGAEYLGAQSGLGYIIVYSEQFAYLDRMFLIALVIVVYACVSYAVFNQVALKALAWMPRGSTDVVVG